MRGFVCRISAYLVLAFASLPGAHAMPLALTDLTTGAPRMAALLAAGLTVARPSVPSFSGWTSLNARTYHTVNVAPSWSKKLTPLGRIGDHLFFASDRVLKKSL